MYQNDCVGGWTSGGGGVPIEPPCCSWNGEEEVYEGMYDNNYEYSEQELKWIKEECREKEIEKKEQKVNMVEVFAMTGFVIIVIDGFLQDTKVGVAV